MDDKNNPADFDAKMAALDEHLNPLDEQKKDDKADDQQKEEPNKSQTDDTAASNDVTDNTDDDDGYTIDDSDDEKTDDKTEDTKKDKEETKPEASQVDTRNLTPEQRYILDNLTPIKVHGTVGDSTDVQEFTVLSPEQLPQGFKFLDDRDRSVAQNRFDSLERKAEQLQGQYRNQEAAKSTQEFETREKQADREDIGRLQREGEIPKFKADPSSDDFESDPGVALVQEVLDFKDKRNNQYMQEYQAGRPYKHIGFDEAFQMFKRANPDKVNIDQQKEDEARKEYAGRTTGTKGAQEDTKSKPRAHSGMTSRDLDALIESKTEGW